MPSLNRILTRREVTELQLKLDSSKKPGDIVGYVIGKMYENGVSSFDYDAEAIQEVFDNLARQDPEFNEILRFERSFRGPFSTILSNVLQTLGLAKNISLGNPYHRVFEIKSGIRKVYARSRSKFNDEQIRILNDTANVMKERVGINPQQTIDTA